jgi:glucosamine kinase
MILIAESGSTKTDWRLLDGKGTNFRTSGLNPYFVDSDQITVETTPIFEQMKGQEISEIHFYGTGITDDAKSAIVKIGILKALGSNVEIFTYSDVVAAARSLFGNKSGIACILGTGSNSCYWNGDKIAFQIPPLGFWLGDEGSGGNIGKLLVLDYLHKEMPKNIRNLFEEKYGILERTEILTRAYQQEKPNKYFASFSYFLYEYGNEIYCQSLIKKSFIEFLNKYLLKYPNLDSNHIGFVGSVAYYYSELLTEVCEANGISIEKIIESPIEELVKFHQE